MECIRNKDHRRMLSCATYFLLTFVYGFGFYMNLPQIVFYLKDMKTDYLPVFQGIITVTSAAVAVFAGLFFGRLCDAYGKAKRWISVCCLCNFVGNLLYSIPVSALVLVAGRILVGLNTGGVIAISTAEIARMFPGKPSARAMAFVNIGLAISLVIGPLFNFLLVDVNFNWGWFYIHPTNAPGYVTCVLIMFTQGFVLCFLYNSENVIELGNRAMSASSESAPLIVRNKSTEDITQSSTHNTFTDNALVSTIVPVQLGFKGQIRLLLSSTDLRLLYFCTFFFTFVAMSIEAVIPLVAAEWLGFNASKLVISYVISGSAFILVTVLFASCQKLTNDFYWMVAMATLQISVPSLLIAIYTSLGKSIPATVLYYAWVILGSVTWILEDVLTRAMASRFVPLEIQGFAEGMRLIPRTIGLLLSGFMTSVLFNHVVIVSVGMMVFGFIVVVLLLVRRSTLCSPTRILLPGQRNIPNNNYGAKTTSTA